MKVRVGWGVVGATILCLLGAASWNIYRGIKDPYLGWKNRFGKELKAHAPQWGEPKWEITPGSLYAYVEVPYNDELREQHYTCRLCLEAFDPEQIVFLRNHTGRGFAWLMLRSWPARGVEQNPFSEEKLQGSDEKQLLQGLADDLLGAYRQSR